METFKDIKGFEGIYQVSDLGNVKSLARKGRKTEMILKPKLKRDRHLEVALSKEGVKTYIDVHLLVAIAFLDHVHCGHKIEVDHINEIKTDNRVENLQLLTNREHKAKHIRGVSEYLGVSFKKGRSKCVSCIRINDNLIHLGYFTNELQASNMYQLALRHLNEYKGNSKEFREFIVSL